MNAPLPETCRVIVIGAGPGGLCTAIKLREAGVEDFVILEKAHGVGGTWWHNRYPGAECDVKSHLYSFSFELKRDWSRPYAGQAEILAYLQQTAEKYGVLPFCRFEHAVTSARWDEAAAEWRCAWPTARCSARRSSSVAWACSTNWPGPIPRAGYVQGQAVPFRALGPRPIRPASASRWSARPRAQCSSCRRSRRTAALHLSSAPRTGSTERGHAYTAEELRHFREDPAAIHASRQQSTQN